MMDCHVETHRDWASGQWRATVIETATAATLYVTWPYAYRSSARARAWRWIDEQYRRRQAVLDGGKLFGKESSD